MRLVAAASAVEDVVPLIDAGADELYCGVVPGGFHGAPECARLNRRYDRAANLAGPSGFNQMAQLAAARGVPVSVALNEHAYAPELIPALVELVHELAAAGARAVIATDLALLLALRRAGLGVELHLSSVATCQNAEAAAFFADLGVTRVILPRYLSTRQIARLIEAGPSLEYEAFVINDGCGYEEGLCLNLHHPAGPMCQMDWQTEPLAGPGASPGLAQEWAANWAAYRYLMRLLDQPGGATTAEGFPKGPCGICALPALQAAGVGHLKIPGRTYPLALRVGSVRLVRAALEWLGQGESPQGLQARARALKDTSTLCDTGYTCYFRGEASGWPGRPVTLSELAVAVRDQGQRANAGPRIPRGSQAVDAPARPAPEEVQRPAPAAVAPAWLRKLEAALEGKAVHVTRTAAGLDLAFADPDQEGGVSRVSVAPAEPQERYYARSGDLGLWYAGARLTPRVQRVLAGVVRALGSAQG